MGTKEVTPAMSLIYFEATMRKVRVQKGKLDYFRRMAKKSDKEIQTYLVGRVISPELIVIDDLAYTKNYHTQTPDNVRWFQEDLDNLKRKAEEQGYKVIGELHSHPGYWPVLSETDYRNLIVEGHYVTGICATMGKKSEIFFWSADSSLPCTIEYV